MRCKAEQWSGTLPPEASAKWEVSDEVPWHFRVSSCDIFLIQLCLSCVECDKGLLAAFLYVGHQASPLCLRPSVSLPTSGSGLDVESVPQGRRPHSILTVHLPVCLFLRGFGGILADEMGLGKTVQTAAFLACLKFTNQG